MAKEYPEHGSWAPINVGGYSTSHVGGPAHAEKDQPKEAKGNETAHQKSLRESGHTEMGAAARRPLEHNRAESVPHAIPEIHRGSKGLDITNASEQKHEYSKVHAEERDWTTGSTK